MGGRGSSPLLDKKRRLRGQLRELEALLAEQNVAFSAWRTSSLYQVSKDP